jgi:hypothetical protein
MRTAVIQMLAIATIQCRGSRAWCERRSGATATARSGVLWLITAADAGPLIEVARS